MNKYLRIIILILFALTWIKPQHTFAQQVNPQVVAQVRAMLASKGLNENEVRTRLKTKGIDVDKLSVDDLIKNKLIIEQTIAEMEAEKRAQPTMQTSTPVTVVDNNIVPIAVSKKEQAAEIEQEKFISTLLPSKIYGHSIFRDNSMAIYRVSKDASPPDSYILAPGDKINVLIFGRSQADLQYEINSSGFIQPAQMPKIFLNGLTLKQAKELLSARFSAYYVFGKEQFALTLNTSRTLNVNIFGEIEKAGSFTTSALNTALNVLSASGGPTEIGTIRNIQIIRGNTKKILDVYAFMRNPILQFDFFLQNNDIIYVPPAETIVTVEGAVNRPMKYELKAVDKLKDLIEYAGGLKGNTNTDIVQIKRYENNQEVLKDFVLADVLSGKTNIVFKNGDIVTFKTINSPVKNYVTVDGAVEYPGEYDLATTKTLKDLVAKAKLHPDAKFGYIYRTRLATPEKTEYLPVNFNYDENLALEANDTLVVINKNLFVLESTIYISGDVKNPQQLRFDTSLTIQDLIKLAGGLTISADINRIDVFRLKLDNQNTPEKELITIAVDKEFKPLPPHQNFGLKPFDLVVVRQIPEFTLLEMVQLNGEVKHPGAYAIKSRQYYFSDLLKDAGGLNPTADLSNATLVRYADSSGVVVFNAKDALSNKQSNKYDPILQDRDWINIPKLDNTISIDPLGTKYTLGENQKSLQIIYQGKKSASWYVRNFAGGFDEKADKASLRVVRENGLVSGTNKVLGLFYNFPKVTYGDKIMLSLKPVKTKEAQERKPFDWDKFLTKVISVATVYALITSATN
jgi:polysaccharide export outer membrane protein